MHHWVQRFELSILKRLLKMTDHVIFSFDGDAAGRKAAKRAMDLSLPLLDDAQKVSFVFLPEGEDPDSLVKKSGAPAFEEMLKKALPLSSYLIEALSQGLDLAVLEDRNAFIEEASPLVRKTKSPLLRDGLIERLSTAVGYKNSDELRKYFGFPVLAAGGSSETQRLWQSAIQLRKRLRPV